MGRANEGYAPYIGTIFAFILFGSSLGIFGLRPVTADLNVTAALAIMTFMIIQISGIRKLGVKGRLKEMAEPYPFIFPMKVLEELTLPVSLALRLFGNIFGGVIVVDLWMGFMEYLSGLLTDVPFLRAVTVLPLNGFFDMFEPVIQTYIFTMLTMVNLASAIGGVANSTVTKLIAIGAGIAVGLAALGIALGQGFGVGKAMEGISKQPEAAGNIRTTLIVGMAIMETMGVLSFVIAILMALKL